MKLLYILSILISLSCTSTPTNDGVFVAVSSANNVIQDELIGLDGKSLESITFEDIQNIANSASPEDQIFSRYRDVIKEAKDINIYPHKEYYVMCMKWTNTYLCDRSDCLGVEYSSPLKQLERPEELGCKG